MLLFRFCCRLRVLHASAMDFAERQLKKMGWRRGKGLGKNEDGMAKPLKPKSQHDSCGLGYDRTSGFNTDLWFARIDDAICAARKGKKNRKKQEASADVRSGEAQDEASAVNGSEVNVADVGVDRNANEADARVSSKFYAQFTKPHIMVSSTCAQLCHRRSTSADTAATAQETSDAVPSRKRKCLDLDQVFKATRGATCHRSAHVGVKMSGKMQRLLQQELESS